MRFLKRHSRLAREPNGCILWAGAKDGRGYGAAGFAGKTRGAHRITAHLFLGMPLDYPGEVCHRCDTPACVAPGCLFLGTHKDNMADASAKGRMTGKRKPVAPWKPTHAHLAVMQENLDRLKAGLPALARQDLIERLGPLPEPIPEEGP